MIDDFDLILLLLSLILQLPDLLVLLLHLFFPNLLIGSEARLFGQGWNFSSIVYIVLDVFEPESGFVVLCLGLVIGLLFSVPTHVWLKNILNNIKLNQSARSNYKFFHRPMIKINSVFPNKDLHRQVAIQTDALLPKILPSPKKSNFPSPMAHHHVPVSNAQTHKNCKQARQFNGAWPVSTLGSVDLRNETIRHPRYRKQNSHASHETSKLEAKSFKFLRFEENLLKSALLKHLDGRELSKSQKKKLEQTVTLSFVFTNTHPQDGETDEADRFDIVELPQHDDQTLSVADIVDGIRDAYLKLSSHTKDKDPILGSSYKKIAHIAEAFLTQGKNIQTLSPFFPNWSKAKVLSNYFQQYVKQSEVKFSYFDSQDAKMKLMTFYQQIYNRYEAIPFNEESIDETPVAVPIDEGKLLKLLKQTLVSKPTPSNDQSFIKLRFYNNLRKQIKHLGEDTEKIISDEVNKLNHV